MKKCAIISTYANNAYRRKLINDQIKIFRSRGIDVILTSSDHINKFDDVSNYITVKNVSDARYLSRGLHAYFGNGMFIFTRYEQPNKFTYSNYFIKLYQSVFNYAKHLGYDFAYFIDQDVILNEKHFDVCFSETLDTTKAYFYNIQEADGYQVIFFYGNLDVLTDCFSEKNLAYLEKHVQMHTVITVEQTAYLLCHRHWNVITNKMPSSDIFYKNNLFSSRNVADIYYFEEDKHYYFLMSKGDTCDNVFSAEMYVDDTLIFQHTMRDIGVWHFSRLEDNRKYTIKYYDDIVSPDTLSKTNVIYTDTNNISVPHRMTRMQ